MKHDPKGISGKGKFSKPAVEGYTEVVHKNNKFQDEVINKRMDQIPEEEFEKYLQDNKLTDDYLWHTQVEGGQTNTANIDKLQNAIIELDRITDKEEKEIYTKAIEEDMKNLSLDYKNKETFRVNDDVNKLNETYQERHTEKKGLKKEVSTDIE
jgi:hypothetical protein